MTDTGSYQENQEIDAQQYVSINVPNAPNVHYFRVGTADTNTENNLPADPNVPTGDTNAQAGNTISDGIALVTTGSYTLNAPSINSWSSDSLAAVTDGNGSLYTATYTTGAAHGMRPATVTFQNVDQMVNTAAASVNFLNGDALTYWNGNDQSLGIGGLLWANYGFTTNLFGGQILNLTNNSAEVQGYGAFKVNDSTGIVATDSINLAISPAGKGAYAACNALIFQFTAVMAVLTAITTAMNLAMTIELKTSGLDEASLKKSMQNLYDQQIAATTLVTVIQVMSIILGAILRITQPVLDGTALSSINLNPFTGITLKCGPNSIAITPAGIVMETPEGISMIGGDTSVLLNDGGAEIVTASAISMIVDATELEVSPAGLTVTAPLVEFLPG